MVESKCILDLLATIVDNRGKTVPISDEGLPLLATNCIDEANIYPKYEKLRYVSQETLNTWFRGHIATDDILFVNKGTPGRVCLVPDPVDFCVAQDMVALRCDNEKVNFKYLFAFLRSDWLKKYISNWHVGVAIPHFKKQDFKRLMVPLPNRKVQDVIGNIYHDISKKIDLTNQINTELESMAKLIYDYWFVQFDFPISAEQAAVMGDASLEGRPYKSSGGKMVWSEELKREIPDEKGWSTGTMSSYIANEKGGDWGKVEQEGNYVTKVLCIRGADLNGLNGKGSMKTPQRFILEKNEHKLLEPHDLIVEISGGSPTQSTGRLGFIIDETLSRFDSPIICSNFCKAVTLKSSISLFNFKLEWERLYTHGVFLGYEGKTSGIKNFLFDSFVSNFPVSIAPDTLMEQFYNQMLPIYQKQQVNLKENQELSTLRDWLLPMLMNGQVRVEK